MGQQLGIVVLVDVPEALRAGSLEGNTYLVDNAKWAGSTGEGTGNLITAVDCTSMEVPVLNWVALDIGNISPQTTLITDISGEAVDKYVMFPAQYGSPDLLSDGLYWSATVDPNLTGLFAYTLQIAILPSTGDSTTPLATMSCESHISVTRDNAKNGFSASCGMIPI